MTSLVQYTCMEHMMSLNHTLQICWVQNQEHQEVHRDQIVHREEHPYLHRFKHTDKLKN